MNDLADVQELMRDTIAAGTVEQPSFFEDGDVIADTGTSRNDIESRLASRGFVVVVDLPINGKILDRAPSVSQVLATIPVHVQFNPQQNSASGGAGKSLLEILDVVNSALLAYGSDATDRFEHAEEDAFELVVNDAGLIGYVCWFRAHIVLSEVVEL